MEFIKAITDFAFMQHALYGALLISVSLGIVGTMVVVNRIVFLSGGVAHSSYGGIGISLYYGFSPVVGASLFAVLSALILGNLTYANKSKSDTLIGAIWAIGMSVGIIFSSLLPGDNGNLMTWLFGNILTVAMSDITIMCVVDLFIILIFTVFYKEFLVISWDTEFAKVSGINVKLFYNLLLIVVSITVVFAMRMVGLILVIALLSIPPSIAERFSTKLWQMMLFSVVLNIFFSLSGLIISFYMNLPAGAIIVITAAIFYILFYSFPIKNIKKIKIES